MPFTGKIASVDSFDTFFAECMRLQATRLREKRLRRLQQQLQYTVKVKSTEEHPSRKIFEPHRTTLCWKYIENSEPIYNKVRDFVREQQTISWFSLRLPPTTPWRRKECSVDISVSKSGNKKHSPEAVNSMARVRIYAYIKRIYKFYLYASKKFEGKSCCILHCRTRNRNKLIKVLYHGAIIIAPCTVPCSPWHLGSSVGFRIIQGNHFKTNLLAQNCYFMGIFQHYAAVAV